VLWGLLFGGACAVVVRDRRVMLVVAALVVSHWVLDWITHRPDMPLYPGGPKAGLGLWNSIPGTIAVEVAMFAVGVWMYAQATRPRDAIGRRAFAAFVGFLLAAYFGSMGPPPPGIRRDCRRGDCGSGGHSGLGLVVRPPPGSRRVSARYGASATVVASTEPSTCFGPVTLTLAPFAVAAAHVVAV
jgi:hypothetical protein